MLFKIDGIEAQMKSLLAKRAKDIKFSIVHFSPMHYFRHLDVWTPDVVYCMVKPDVFNAYYVIEEKESHMPLAVSDSTTELQIYADLYHMKLSE